MSQNIIIEFAFNEKRERENQKFYFNYVWGKILKNWIKITACSAVFLFLGFYPIENFDTSFFYYFFKYGGICLTGYSLVMINQYFASKKHFKKEIDILIEKFRIKNEPHFIILNDQSIEFKNPFTTINTVWENTSYVISGDYILIIPINSLNYIIHKSEVSVFEFETIIEYLHKHSKHRK
ncbi:hypothetical protein IW15_18950 [Chryseobacterium soli]|uniref:YcxB-like protein domain-containing protein n=1 Tax=Chryseobacterium soli TaxID=445961 RepID=A0A086A262_9FLAO|nr:hypothetical protein [Chryseobacterium soli]KFF10776.1 hypothetical protein IW15_18950 [Chryseobacterium soli]